MVKNIACAEGMINAGRMTNIYRRLFGDMKNEFDASTLPCREQMALWRTGLINQMDSTTMDLYSSLPPSFQMQYAGWVMSGQTMSGQKKETCKNCLDELEATLAKGERLELK